MSRDEQKLRDLLTETSRAFEEHEEELPDEEILHIKPKPKKRKKPETTRNDPSE